MNQEKIGKFILECRKNKKLTQSELAEKLGVTDKSISNWENGRNMPDLSLFKPLCSILEISINDLISGEKVSKDKYQDKFEENIINTIDYTNKKINEKSDEEINDLMPAKMKRKIVSKGIKFFVTNAESLASKFNLKGKTSSIISAYMLDMLGCSPEDREKFVEIVKKSLKGKDEETIKNNENVITHRADYLREYDVNKFTFEEN